MPSPLPGMDPYLEQPDIWNDFHDRLIVAIADSLAEQIDPRYFTKIEKRLYIRESSSESSRYLGRSDVAVRTAATDDVSELQGSVGLLDAPAEVLLPETDVERVRYIEIRGARDKQIVAAIELLSPSNKYAGDDREQYLFKRAEILHGQVHFVEIDLLRGGPRMPMTDAPDIEYCVVVSRVENRPRAGIWSMSLRDELPKIPVPLRSPDNDAYIDLQKLVNAVYDSARYRTHLYDGEPQPQLSGVDRAWAESLIGG